MYEAHSTASTYDVRSVYYYYYYCNMTVYYGKKTAYNSVIGKKMSQRCHCFNGGGKRGEGGGGRGKRILASSVSFQLSELHPPFGVLSLPHWGEGRGELTQVFCTTIIILYFIIYHYYYYYCSSTVGKKTGKISCHRTFFCSWSRGWGSKKITPNVASGKKNTVPTDNSSNGLSSAPGAGR